MTRYTRLLHHMLHLAGTLLTLLVDVVRFLRLCLRPAPVLAAENLFLRKQLACIRSATSNLAVPQMLPVFILVWLARWFDWRQALVVVQPANLYPLASPGVPPVLALEVQAWTPTDSAELQALIRQMARENPTWGQERIANELLAEAGPACVATHRTEVHAQAPGPWSGQRGSSQRWQTFVRNHAQAIVACDFCVVVTATFRLLYVFVVMEHATRRILHVNVTAHPTAPWTLQQLREAIPADHAIVFCSMTAIVFSPRSSTEAYGTWGSGC